MRLYCYGVRHDGDDDVHGRGESGENDVSDESFLTQDGERHRLSLLFSLALRMRGTFCC